MVPTSSNDTDIDIDMDESSSGAVSDAVTNPLPPQKTKNVASATLWLVVFAVLVIGASIAGGYMLAMRQVNAGAQLSDAGGSPIARDDSNDTIISEPLESEEAEISPEPESSEQDSVAAKNTGIDILVDVVGARVSLDGHYLGQAPLRVRNILPGSHQIAVANADGSKVQERTVELFLGEAKVVSIILGSVEIAKDDKSDKTRGQESKKGRERRKASDSEEKEKEKEKKQMQEQASSSTTDAEKVSLGTLMLGSKPPCAIEIDGKATGTITPQRAIQLPEGLHRVVLTNSEQGISKSFKVRIKAGRTTRAIQDLRPKL